MRDILLCIATIVATALAMILTLNLGNVRIVPSDTYEISYADLITTLLTSVTVIITVFAALVAFITFIGWRNIRLTSKRAAEAYIEKTFEPGNEGYNLLQEAALRGIEKIDPRTGDDEVGDGSK